MTMSNQGNSVAARSTFITGGDSYFESNVNQNDFGDLTADPYVITDSQVVNILGVANLTPKHVTRFTDIAAGCGITYKDGNDGPTAAVTDDVKADKEIQESVPTSDRDATAANYADHDTYSAPAATNLDRFSDKDLDKADTAAVTNTLADYNTSMANKDNWSIGFSYDLDTINIGVGMDSSKGIALSLGTSLSDVDVTAFYGKSEHEDVILHRKASNPIVRKMDNRREEPKEFTCVVDFTNLYDGYTIDPTMSVTELMGTRENTGIGVSAAMAAGEGATFSVAYSTNKMEQTATKHADLNKYKDYNGTATTKLIEIDFEYALGGGATLKAGIDKKDVETISTGTKPGESVGDIVSSDVTTLSASIAMTF